MAEKNSSLLAYCNVIIMHSLFLCFRYITTKEWQEEWGGKKGKYRA